MQILLRAEVEEEGKKEEESLVGGFFWDRAKKRDFFACQNCFQGFFFFLQALFLVFRCPFLLATFPFFAKNRPRYLRL